VGWWGSCTSPSYHDGDSAQSGSIANSQESWLQTTVTGPGTVWFWWKVSSQQNCDWLEFYIDGTRQDRISGTVDWQQKTYTVTGAGSHTFKWRYVKDGSGTSGIDCGWVDWLQWPSQPVQSVQPPAQWKTVTYTYDPMGRRIAKSVDSWTQKYVYDGDMAIADYDGSGNLLRKYVYADTDQPICMINVADNNAVSYYHYDGLGSVVALSNASGDTVQTYEYGVYGQVKVEDANNPNPFMFTGQRFDVETGLCYYKARYYNAGIGRFMQTDPVGYDAGINWYAYCGNNPTNGTDPSGGVSFVKVPGTAAIKQAVMRLLVNMIRAWGKIDEMGFILHGALDPWSLKDWYVFGNGRDLIVEDETADLLLDRSYSMRSQLEGRLVDQGEKDLNGLVMYEYERINSTPFRAEFDPEEGEVYSLLHGVTAGWTGFVGKSRSAEDAIKGTANTVILGYDLWFYFDDYADLHPFTWILGFLPWPQTPDIQAVLLKDLINVSQGLFFWSSPPNLRTSAQAYHIYIRTNMKTTTLTYTWDSRRNRYVGPVVGGYLAL